MTANCSNTGIEELELDAEVEGILTNAFVNDRVYSAEYIEPDVEADIEIIYFDEVEVDQRVVRAEIKAMNLDAEVCVLK